MSVIYRDHGLFCWLFYYHVPPFVDLNYLVSRIKYIDDLSPFAVVFQFKILFQLTLDAMQEMW